MTLSDYKDLASRLLQPVVSAGVRAGLTPNQVSIISFCVAVVAAVTYYFATPVSYFVAGVLVVTSGLLDVVDGEIAREMGAGSKRGDFLDHVLDRYSDMVIVGGIAAGLGSWLLGVAALTGVFLTSYMGTQAQAVGGGREYGGLLGRADRMAIISGGSVVQAGVRISKVELAYFSPLGWVLVVIAVVGNLTAIQRFVGTWRELDGS
ncbi:MAG: CDP-alcohol phosphatidyltransferase family protein [Halobacteria archaeon]|nr:CDP-alcohol phosphatidyltransferase family protein [Halobacteria archaeon]